MKVMCWVSVPDQEIEVNIDGADAVNAILGGAEDWTSDQLLRKACNNFLVMLQNMPDSEIAKQPQEVRKIIGDVMESQAKRFLAF
jgi:hypothetical protein